MTIRRRQTQFSPPGEPVRFGVIGCGVIAYWTHLRELRKVRGARLVAAADPDAGARERAGRLTGVPVHASAGELLARPDVDAVVISAPPAAHAELALAAAAAGKHFYIEKPLATTEEDGRRVIEAASREGIGTAVGFNRRCHPAFEQARALLADGAIGRVHAVQTVFSEPVASGEQMPAWKRRRSTGGGVLLDLASHHIDSLRWLLQDDIVSVESRVESRNTEDDEAWLRLSLRKSGAAVSGFYSFRAGRADTLEFLGERGTLRIDRFRSSLSLRLARRFGYGVRSARLLPGPGAISWRLARFLRPSWEPSYRRALGGFADLCRGGSPRNLASLDDGLRSLEVILAAEESARRGEAVHLPRRSADQPPCASFS